MKRSMKQIALNMAASGLSLGTLAALGIAAPAFAQGSEAADPRAASLFDQAGQAVREDRITDAVGLLEQAVGLAPRDAGFRMMLADAYMKSGRFMSAETTYGDVLAIDPARPRAGLTRALMQVATGRPQEAIAQLDTLEGQAPVADLGLAYALAGSPQRAVDLLETAARTPGASSRVRQNLALAYAFGGDWERARTIAAQDLQPSEVSARMTEWAKLAHRAGSPEPVAAMIGVQPVEDPGQPVQIALNLPTSDPIRTASAEPVAVDVAQVEAVDSVPMPTDSNSSAAVEPAPVAFAAAEPAPVEVPLPNEAPAAAVEPVVTFAEAEPAPVAPPAPIAAPSEAEAYAEVDASDWGVDSEGQVALPEDEPTIDREPARVRYAAAAEALVRPDPVVMPIASRAARAVAPIASRAFRTAPLPGNRKSGASFVVQVGAFSSAANAERAWKLYEDEYGLAAETPVTMTFDHRGRLLHRVALSGFERRDEATQVCRILTARGARCFVRNTAGDASIDWAARYGKPD